MTALLASNMGKFAQNRAFWVFTVIIMVLGCIPRAPLPQKPLLRDRGEILLYLQPLPQEARRLVFTVDEVSAIGEDGTAIPIPLLSGEFRGSELMGTQSLLGTAILPPGSYRGLAIRVRDAFLRSDAEDKAALLVPEKPVLAEHPFTIRAGKALALFLTLSASKPVPEGFQFTPRFYLNPQGQELTNLTGYVTNAESNLISVFNKKTMRITGAIATGRSPGGMAVDQVRSRVYIALSGEDAVDAIDLFTGERLGRITLRLGDRPRELALTPDGRVLVSANKGSNTASLIDPLSLFEVRRVSVGQGPASVVVDRTGLRAYILNERSRTLSVIDLARQEAAGIISVEGSPVRGAFSRTGDRLYVVSPDSPNLMVIDPPTLAVAEKIFVGTGAVSVRVDTRSDLVYVGKRSGGEVLLVDPASSMFVDRIETGGPAAFMTIDDEENTLFVVDPENRRLQKISLVSKRVLSELELGEGAYAVIVIRER